MPPSEDSAARKVAEFRIDSQLETLENFKRPPHFFCPVNHDWRGWGVKGLKTAGKKYVQKAHQRGNAERRIRRSMKIISCH